VRSVLRVPDFLHIGPHRLEYAWFGERAPTALVLLHEGLGSLGLWRDFPGKLADAARMPVFAYSRANYGASSASAPLPRPVRYMHDEAVVLGEVLRAAAIAEPILFGHSDGASIAILYARAAPVRGLILEAPHVFAEEVGLRSIEKAREAFEHGDLRARLARWHEHVDEAFWGWNGPWLHPGFRGWNLTGCLAAITAPALLVQGAADEYGTLAQVGAIEHGLRGRVEKLILPDVGHAPHRDGEATVVDAAAKFVASLPRTPK
jgi:pimeloyl-ACP methyl ester carboxylesterase